jgi:hypothetical protein
MKVFPQGAWFGLTRRRLRVAGRTFVAIISLCAMVYGAARITQALEYRRAAVFLEELKNIQPGQPESSVMQFILRYQGTRPENQSDTEDDLYIMRVNPWFLTKRLPGPDWVDRVYRSTFSRLGTWRRAVNLRSWSVSGWVRLTNGKVEKVSGDVVMEGENEWLMAEWQYGREIPAYLRSGHPSNNLPGEELQYEAHWTHLHIGYETGEGTLTFVTPRSTLEELNAARNINLQCLTNGKGCHSLCELMPDATRYRREHKGGGWGWNSGSWGIQPHDCE